jgi:hypothetical protein
LGQSLLVAAVLCGGFVDGIRPFDASGVERLGFSTRRQNEGLGGPRRGRAGSAPVCRGFGLRAYRSEIPKLSGGWPFSPVPATSSRTFNAPAHRSRGPRSSFVLKLKEE